MSKEDVEKWLEAKPQGLEEFVLLLSFSEDYFCIAEASVGEVARMLCWAGEENEAFARAVRDAARYLGKGGEK